MKKINLRGISEILSEKEMKNVMGGNNYRCCCGMGSNAVCFDVIADSMSDAIWMISNTCSEGIGGCFA